MHIFQSLTCIILHTAILSRYLWIMINFCKVCNKKVLFYSFQLKCSLCLKCVQLRCLPHINRDDSIYRNKSSNSGLCIECCKETFPFNNTDDDGKCLAFISETWLCKIDISVKALSNKLFFPFDFNNDKNVLSLNNIDPDLHYYNSISYNIVTKCEYSIEDTFNKRIDKDQVTSDSFSLLHMNIRSLPKHLLEFQSYIKTINLFFP